MIQVNSFVISLILVSLPFGVESTRKITVMVSQLKPFAFFDNGTRMLKGLDVKIVENFGKKLNLQIEYVTANESLNEVFSSGNRIQDFFKSAQNS